MVAVYPGVTMRIPDFTIDPPVSIVFAVVPVTGTTTSTGTFVVHENKAFLGTVDMSTFPDRREVITNPENLKPVTDPVTGLPVGLVASPDPITYNPRSLPTVQGSQASVTMSGTLTAGASQGVHALWLRGHSPSHSTTKLYPFGLEFGDVRKNFVVPAPGDVMASAVGDTVSATIKVQRWSPSGRAEAFGGTTGVSLTLEPLPDSTTGLLGSMPAGLGVWSFSPANVLPGTGQGTQSTLTIHTGTLTAGRYQFAIRATGINGDQQVVTRLTPLTVYVGTSSTGGNQEYVDIVGFAVMRITDITTNSVSARATTPMILSMNDPQLRRGQVARLAPWNN